MINSEDKNMGWKNPEDRQQYSRQYYQAHKAQIAQYQEVYNQNHKDQANAYQHQYYLNHKKRRLAYHQSLEGRYSQYQTDAKKRHLIFILTLEEFQIIASQVCYYCGQFSKNQNYCGLDRIDSTQGYLLTNIVPCCRICNWMKAEMTQQEFQEHINRINIYWAARAGSN
jgi:hypothetical protein